jgi:D,D-heptose 1,7-bisphosphate phosphatase
VKQLVIVAGGKGTRLASQIGPLPKALVGIDGRPLLYMHLDLAAAHGFDEVVMLVCHGADLIREACGDGGRWHLKVSYVEESKPRGTAGAVLGALNRLAERFLVSYGDTVLNVDLNRMWQWHAMRSADATLLVHPNDHPHDSDIVELDEEDRVVALHPYPHPAGIDLPNLVNGALYVLERSALAGRGIPQSTYDFGKHLFPAMVASGADLRGYKTREYIKDAGTPERLAKVIADVRSGKVSRGSLAHPAPTVFLDRDGTINPDPGYIADPDQFSPFAGAAEAIKRLNRSDYLTAVITNQSVVARGDATEDTIRRVHNRMETILGKTGAYLDAIYYCPHHPDAGFPGERRDLKIKCDCRKPRVGLIERAVADLGVLREESWFVGDTTVDMETARRAGLRSVLVMTGVAGRDAKFPQRPDFECLDLTEAVSLIVDVWPRLVVQAEAIASGVVPSAGIAIGGLARSGKSSLASALAYVLRRQGRRAVVVSLDGWLLDLDDRPQGGSVLDRHDTGKIAAFAAGLSKPSSAIDVPVYDRFTHARSGSYRQDVSSEDVVIVEGVVALALDIAWGRPVHRIFVTREEQDRRAALGRDYQNRGYSATQIDDLYRDRARDEHDIVLRSRAAAETIIKSSF